VQEIKGAAPDANKHVLGTPAYLAPENVTDPTTVGPAVDLYALGAVGYFLLTGQLVFTGKTNGEIALKHVTDKPRPVSEVAKSKIPPVLEDVIMKCLAKSPGDRYPSAAALAEALEHVPTGDWDRECARTWWETHRKRQAATPRTDAATVTLTIDVGQRVTPGS
jgi:serine/threonine-protein kinase